MVLLVMIICAALLIVVSSISNGISPMPSSRKAIAAVLQLIKETSHGGSIIDLGSGWGSACFAVSRVFPEQEVRGYENSLVPYLYCRLIALLYRRRNLRFFFRNFHAVALDDAGVVLCYLYPGAMTRLKPKFEQELRPGTIVVSNTFAVRQWRPQRVIELKDMYRTQIYLYVCSKKPPP
jgi:hypothetical protein